MRQAFEVIKNGKPKTKIQDLDQVTQGTLHQAAIRWVESGYLAHYGIQLGLMGQWPEFFDMAVARLSKEAPSGSRPYYEQQYFQDNVSIANVMLNHRMQKLTIEQVHELKQVINKTNSESVMRHLFWYLQWTHSQAAIDALWELAQDDRPWIWWRATEAWYARSRHTGPVYDDLSEKMKLRLLLIDDRMTDEHLMGKSRQLLQDVFTPQFSRMSSQAWNKVRESISREFDKKTAAAIYIGYLRRMQSEMTLGHWTTDNAFKGNAKWTVARVIRMLNVWYNLDIANLGTDESRGSRFEPRTYRELMRPIDTALAWYDNNTDATPADHPFAGMVVDSSGKPVAGATLRFTKQEDYDDARGHRRQRRVEVGQCTTDVEGRYSFAGFTNDRSYTLDVTAQSFLPKEELYVNRLADGRYRYHERNAPEDNAIQLQHPGKLSGRIIGADGKPLMYADIRLTSVSPYSERNPRKTVTTDSKGRFTTEGIPKGHFLLSYADFRGVAFGRGMRKAYGGLCGAIRFETEEAEHKSDVVLDLSTSVCVLELDVVDQTGEPMKEISFTLDAKMEGGSYRYAPVFIVTRKSNDGVYRFAGMPPGTWRMRLGTTAIDIELDPEQPARYRVVCDPPSR